MPTNPVQPGDSGHDSDVAVIERPPVLQPKREEKVEPPKMYRVVLHNDDVTHFFFVVQVLREVFNKNGLEAENLMREAHTTGSAVVGVYPKDVAETKVQQATDMARSYQGDPHRQNLRFSSEED